MRSKRQILYSVALATALAGSTLSLTTGCATMSPEQCMVADWYRLGEQDALAGRSSDHLANRAGACQDAGYQSDMDAWYAGFEDALPSFCTLDNGFRFGVEGKSYQNTCPSELAPQFLDGYDMGSEIHELERAVTASNRQVNQLNSEIQRERNSDVPKIDRINRLREEMTELLEDIRPMEVELATLRGVAIGRGFNVPR